MSNTAEALVGKAVDMNSLVTYADGAVVSRTLIDRKIGTVTIFSFDKGQGLSEHTVPFDAFVQVIDGSADVTIDGKVHKVSSGEFIIMPAKIPHSMKAVEKFKMMLVMIRA
ncbi:MAG: cupin domain-containing protein [Geobacteraceae bacterium]|nr:cupin domain-containing protein [Geobacteraceae bacterium]